MCFGIAIITQHYVGYAVVALIVEINSIFLHLRQLLQVLKVPRDSLPYRINSLVNLGKLTFIRILEILIAKNVLGMFSLSLT